MFSEYLFFLGKYCFLHKAIGQPYSNLHFKFHCFFLWNNEDMKILILSFFFPNINRGLIFVNVIHYSKLQLWVGFSKFTPVFFYLMLLMVFFNSIKGINRLTSKGMSNIYLKFTIEKNRRPQNFDFLSLKYLSPGHFLGSSRRYHLILKRLVTT